MSSGKKLLIYFENKLLIVSEALCFDNKQDILFILVTHI